MPTTIKKHNELNLDNPVEDPAQPKNLKPLVADVQVKVRKPYSPRRSYDTAYKLRIISAYDACENATARGALLRKEGLYHSRICDWKKQYAISNLDNRKKQSTTLRTDHLTKENEQLKKKLAQAEAIIDLQKKVSEFFTTHILPQEDSEKKS